MIVTKAGDTLAEPPVFQNRFLWSSQDHCGRGETTQSGTSTTCAPLKHLSAQRRPFGCHVFVISGLSIDLLRALYVIFPSLNVLCCVISGYDSGFCQTSSLIQLLQRQACKRTLFLYIYMNSNKTFCKDETSEWALMSPMHVLLPQAGRRGEDSAPVLTSQRATCNPRRAAVKHKPPDLGHGKSRCKRRLHNPTVFKREHVLAFALLRLASLKGCPFSHTSVPHWSMNAQILVFHLTRRDRSKVKDRLCLILDARKLFNFVNFTPSPPFFFKKCHTQMFILVGGSFYPPSLPSQ